MEPEVRERFEQIEAILAAVARNQLAAEARSRESAAQHEKRMDAFEKRMDGFERRMLGFEKLARIGLRQITLLARSLAETNQKLDIVISEQQRIDAKLQTFMDSMRKGTNGRHGRRL